MALTSEAACDAFGGAPGPGRRQQLTQPGLVRMILVANIVHLVITEALSNAAMKDLLAFLQSEVRRAVVG